MCNWGIVITAPTAGHNATGHRRAGREKASLAQHAGQATGGTVSSSNIMNLPSYLRNFHVNRSCF